MSLTAVPVIPSCSTTGCLKSSLPWVTAEELRQFTAARMRKHGMRMFLGFLFVRYADMDLLGSGVTAQTAVDAQPRTSHCRRKEGQYLCSPHISCQRLYSCFGCRSVSSQLHIAEELPNGYRGCSVARTVSSRRRIGGRAMELVNNHEYFLGSAIVVLTQSLTHASSSRELSMFDCKRASVNLCVESKEHLEGSCVFCDSDSKLRWLDVCICRMHREIGIAFAVCQGCLELVLEDGRVS